MYSRDLERLVRQMQRQKCDADYIRHYLMEEYQLDPKLINEVFERVGPGPGQGAVTPAANRPQRKFRYDS